MKYELSIREHNKQAHIDIENDIQKRRNGLFTFTLRVNAQNIVDYNLTEYVNAKEKYLSLKRIVITELPTSRNSRERGQPNSFWPNYVQRRVKGRSRPSGYFKHSQKPQKKI